MEHAEQYEIRLPYVRLVTNVHDKEAPEEALFQVVGPGSPRKWRVEVERLAYYFRREFGYDFPPYTADEADFGSGLVKDRVLVFFKATFNRRMEDVLYFYGAIGVHWRVWADAPASWSIAWVWFHPYERRKGHLTSAWPFLIRTYPDLWVEHPLSKAMEEFLKKVGHTRPLENPPSAK
jgi:hypothetical protein